MCVLLLFVCLFFLVIVVFVVVIRLLSWTPIPEIAEQIDPENFEIMDLEEETKCPQGKSVEEAQDTPLMVSEDLAQSSTTSQEKVKKFGLGVPDLDTIVEHIDKKRKSRKC